MHDFCLNKKIPYIKLWKVDLFTDLLSISDQNNHIFNHVSNTFLILNEYWFYYEHG